MKNYDVLAFYIFTPIEDPQEEVRLHKAFFQNRDVMSRIYISETGINGQISASKEHSKEYREWMLSRPNFYEVHFKLHDHHEHVFPRQTVKYRKQLVAFDEEIDTSCSGDHVSPKQWKEMLSQDDGHLVLDIRNDYEWKVGHFEGAKCPPCATTRDFRRFTENLLPTIDKENTPIMMYCTGGIRCEIYSAILKQNGVKHVFQLEGGVINYGLVEGSDYWKGKLFVFDDRLTVPISNEETEVIGRCHSCCQPAENYYNCANMDCNELFICCQTCLEKYSGCCCSKCMEAPHVRPCHDVDNYKPFRRKHCYT